MRIPKMQYSHRHNLAVVHVSFWRRIWHTRELDDGSIVLGYNATGRLARVLVLDARRVLPVDSVGDALRALIGLLDGRCDVPARDVLVLRSALSRARC